MDSALQLGLPEARLPLAEACIFLATLPKSNTACVAIDAALADVEREQGYLYPHDFPHRWVKQQYLPDELKDRKYYEYGDNKTEQTAKRYWEEIKD